MSQFLKQLKSKVASGLKQGTYFKLMPFQRQNTHHLNSHSSGFKFGTATIFLGLTAMLALPIIQSVNAAEAEVEQTIQKIQPFEDTNQGSEGKDSSVTSYFSYGLKMIPHIEKRHRGGEDAYYADDQILVVLDGVGGWNDAGVDPGLFSRQLVSYISEEHRNSPEKTLKQSLVDAVKRTTFKGSSTACLVRLDQSEGNGSVLKSTNLGDSGYVIFRVEKPKADADSQPVISKQFRSKEQQYRFNFPYQCGTNCDLPYDAFDTQHTLEDEDLVIVGSDGLFDNVYDEDMLPCITPQLEVGSKKVKNLLEVASCLANKAEEHGMDRKYFSPFAKGAREARVRYIGGKLDDVTVVVAQFHARSSSGHSTAALSPSQASVDL